MSKDWFLMIVDLKNNYFCFRHYFFVEDEKFFACYFLSKKKKLENSNCNLEFRKLNFEN